MKEIKILGAGLSGLTAAINLAKKGYKVDVYEKNKDVGMRFHGDIQGLENWSEKKDILEELKEMNIDINFDCNAFSSVILTNGLKAKKINTKRPAFYLVKRGSFSGTIDYGLKVQALKSDINVHFQKTLSPNEADIVATGPVPKEVVGVVRGIILTTDVKDTAIVAINDKLAFKGYSYFLVTKGHGCMCTVVRRGEVFRANEYFEKTKEFFVRKLGLHIRPLREVVGVGSFSLKKVKKGATSYVGEAAGLQDFLWGFGMRFAITSGYLAAQSIINNKDYEKIAEKHLGNRLRAGVVNRYLWENILSKKDYSILINFAELVDKNIYSMCNFNLLQRIVYPLALFSLKTKYPKLKL
jgi:flavin-dependent dehydrogenase